MPLMYKYLVNGIFTVINKISNYSLHSSPPTLCQAKPRSHAEAIDADSKAHRRDYP